MTTIAYRDGIMAGDGRETIQNDDHSSWYTLQDRCRKVIKLKDGRLFGGAHGSESIVRLEDALRKGLHPPKLEDIAGLLVDTKGHMWLFEGNIWQRVKGRYYSVGSGSIIAFAAMDAGATAIEAVTIAARRDPFSGGKVTAVRLSKRR
jgi:hypothetical protein